MDTLHSLQVLQALFQQPLSVFTGHVFDLIYTDHLWISWALSTGALGFVFGFAIHRNNLRQESFFQVMTWCVSMSSSGGKYCDFRLITDSLMYCSINTPQRLYLHRMDCKSLLIVAIVWNLTLKLYANYKLKQNKQ